MPEVFEGGNSLGSGWFGYSGTRFSDPLAQGAKAGPGRVHVAYGLRADEESDENTKTNITQMEASFVEAISRLEELGLVKQDNWGVWIWTETGRPVGSDLKNDNT